MSTEQETSQETFQEIGNGIKSIADAVVILQTNNLLEPLTIQEANDLLRSLIAKGQECLAKCAKCCEEDATDNGGGQTDTNCVEDAWKQFQLETGLGQDYCANLSLIQSKTDVELQAIIKLLLYTLSIDPATCKVGDFYPELVQIESDANASGNIEGFFRDWVTAKMSELMGQTPADCTPTV